MSMQGRQENTVSVAIPGIAGITLVYRPELGRVDTQRIEAAATILAHWFGHRKVQIEANQVRQALRRFSSPWLLGETELAHVLFDHVPGSSERGAALQSLLHELIDRLDPGNSAKKERRRGHLLLRQLYIDRRMPQQISHELGLSSRQYQRSLSDAIVALSQMLSE